MDGEEGDFVGRKMSGRENNDVNTHGGMGMETWLFINSFIYCWVCICVKIFQPTNEVEFW